MSRRVCLFAFVALTCAAPPARAWKPKTHVYLAEEAMKDAVDDGLVTIYEVDPATNQLKKGADGKPVKVGDYKVDPRVLEALKKHPDQFRAGVLGPDAFPDILTGQQVIHPAGKVTPGESGADLNKNGPGPDPWLQHLWSVAYAGKGADATPATRAFVSGFLAHAAGDVYGHTCVNYYTGDAFNFQNPKNAARHVIVEGYFDRHVPAPTYKTSIAGVDGFIHRQMILGRPGTPVEKLLAGDNVKFTLAAQFSALRNRLNADVQGALPFDPVAAYKKAWVADIDRGLEKLPGFSYELALALMYDPSGKADLVKARKLVDGFKPTLMSMAGLPDAVAATIAAFKAVAKALGLDAVVAFVDQVEKDALNYLVRTATGMTADEFAKLLLAEATEFDKWMDQPPLPNGTRTTRKEFDEKELKLDPKGNGWIDYRRVPPAYNTVALIKLSFLSRDEVNRLMADLGAPAVKLAEENAMLGFAATLDGSNQWAMNPQKMVVARHPAGYARVFMKQNGETRP